MRLYQILNCTFLTFFRSALVSSTLLHLQILIGQSSVATDLGTKLLPFLDRTIISGHLELPAALAVWVRRGFVVFDRHASG